MPPKPRSCRGVRMSNLETYFTRRLLDTLSLADEAADGEERSVHLRASRYYRDILQVPNSRRAERLKVNLPAVLHKDDHPSAETVVADISTYGFQGPRLLVARAGHPLHRPVRRAGRASVQGGLADRRLGGLCVHGPVAPRFARSGDRAFHGPAWSRSPTKRERRLANPPPSSGSARRSATARGCPRPPRIPRPCAWSRWAGRNRPPGKAAIRKRPSDVPPLVESSGAEPVSSSIAATTTSNSSPGGVRKASPEMRAVTVGARRLAGGDLLDHPHQVGAAMLDC